MRIFLKHKTKTKYLPLKGLFASCAHLPTHTRVATSIAGSRSPIRTSIVAGCGPTHVSVVIGARSLTHTSLVAVVHGLTCPHVVAGAYGPTHASLVAGTCGPTHVSIPQNHSLFPFSPHSGLPTWKSWGTLC